MIPSIQPFTNLLKIERKKKKLSQRALALLARVPQSHISNIENGKVDIRLSSLIEIARILELEPMFIPRRYVPAVEGFMETKKHEGTFHSAFPLDDEDNHD